MLNRNLLKDCIGEFGHLSLMPSGGITPENAKDWLDAGAAAVGMGSNLVGGDVRTDPSDEAQVLFQQKLWKNEGILRAERLFDRVSRLRSRL